MATRDTGQPASGITRRAFLQATAAATAVAGCGLEFAFDPAKAAAYENDTANYQVTFTTCPYCSASCGQRVVVAKTGPKAGQIVDLYGDFESPLNSGGLCAKGAGSFQLVTNDRRIGAWEASTYASGHHPTGTDAFIAQPSGTPFPASPAGYSGTAYGAGAYTYADGVAYWRLGNNAWTAVPLPEAMKDIATRLKSARGTLSGDTYNSKKVAFFGSSHMNNEGNYLYRKIIANFGTSNTEHQARI